MSIQQIEYPAGWSSDDVRGFAVSRLHVTRPVLLDTHTAVV